MQIFILLFIFVTILQGESRELSLGKCKGSVTYENRNQIDPASLKLPVISGVALDIDQIPIPNVCLALFSARKHQLVATTTTDNLGKYKFDDVPVGQYRLLAKYPSFCTANIPIKIVAQPLKKNKVNKQLLIRMRLANYDSCSYGEYGK